MGSSSGFLRMSAGMVDNVTEEEENASDEVANIVSQNHFRLALQINRLANSTVQIFMQYAIYNPYMLYMPQNWHCMLVGETKWRAMLPF
jgi:hypothetical protein